MPKKFKGENTKAAEARARKESQKQADKEKAEREKEDEYWRDDDKHSTKKLQRKEEREKKKIETAERKLETKTLLEKETNEIDSKPGMRRPESSTKLTVADISAQSAKEREAKARENERRLKNVNHMVIDGEEARTVDEAILIVNDKETEADPHPEKRMRAAYSAFEGRLLPQLKQEYPSSRLSQLKQMAWREWQKSPEGLHTN